MPIRRQRQQQDEHGQATADAEALETPDHRVETDGQHRGDHDEDQDARDRSRGSRTTSVATTARVTLIQ